MSKPKKVTRCPCCGQTLPEPIVGVRKALARTRFLSPYELAMFNILKSANEGVSNRALLERVCPVNRNGEPTSPKTVPIIAGRLGKKIAAWGMRIETERASLENIYRLVVL